VNLKSFISFRKKLQDVDKTTYGFKGLFSIIDKEDIELISQFEDSEIREVYHKESQETANHKNLNIGDEILILIDLSKFPDYYESFDEFIAFNKYGLKYQEFYIFDMDYHHKISNESEKINTFLELQNIISFLKELSTYDKETNGLLELFFHKPDKICSVIIDYSPSDIQNITVDKSLSDLSKHVFEKSDQEVRRKLFTNEMINLLSVEGIDFENILKYWNTICNSYRNSFQIYLSEFSFEKIKTSSQEYFHELTDRIYSTINKFSAYILAIPVAYILIIRFFDFDGKSFAKDTFLVIIGVLYFVVIWFVLLNNLSKAFNAIENDISKFLKRIKNEAHLSEITDSLNNQKNKLIPSQKRKIWLVRIVCLIILGMTIYAYSFIYYDCIKEYCWKSPVANTAYKQ
jgi:hypothetical protein